MLDYFRIMLNARLAKMDERGASAVEYGLLVAGIAAVIVAVVFLLGGTLKASSPAPTPRSPTSHHMDEPSVDGYVGVVQ